MRRALVLIASCAVSMLVACGSGNNTSSAGGNSVTPPTSAANVAAITVDRGPTGSYTNGLWVTVTVCVPSTTTCQSIDHVLVDTGSMGLRVLGSVLTLNLPTETDASGNTIAQCGQFLDGFTWGPLHTADIKIAGETAASVPMQVIGETSFAVPPACTNTGVNEDTLATLQANGVLGIGVFLQDCGSFCVTSIPSTAALYYSCSSTACNPSTATLAQQLQNPVSKFTTDNNGTIIELPGISNSGATTVSGSLVFGIGTQSNNGLKGAIPLATDSQGNISTVFNGTQYSGTFIDSGSNGLFILDAGTLGIPTCPTQTSFYCPGAPNITALNLRNLTATNFDTVGDQSAVSFGIANAEYLFNLNNGANIAFNDVGGPNVGTNGLSFDWGLPFFYGRNVFTAIENQNTPAGAGPYFAY